MKNIGHETAFLNESGKDNWFPYKKFLLYRREWNAGETKYEWASAWDFTHKVKQVGSASWMLDTVNLNEFKTSNISIQVENPDLEWKENGSVWTGYIPMFSIVKIEAGFKDSEGKEYGEKIFPGFIPMGGIKNNPLTRTATIQVVGLTNYLDHFNAEDCSTTVTDENAGTGDGSNTDFYTANDGVGEITEVKIDAAVQKEGTDYETERLNSKVQKAKIVFATPPAGATTIFISYYHWYQDQKVEYLIKKLLDVAVITNRDIEAAILEDQAESTWVQTSAADWAAGALTHTESTGAGDAASVRLIVSQAEDWSGIDDDEFPIGWDKYIIDDKPSPYEDHNGYAKIQSVGGKSLELGGLINHVLPTWDSDATRVWKDFQSPLDGSGSEYIEFSFSLEWLVDNAIKFYFNSDKRFWAVIKLGAARIDFYLDGLLVSSISNAYIGWGLVHDAHNLPVNLFIKRVDATTVRVYTAGNEGFAAGEGWNITTDVPLDYLEFSCYGGYWDAGTPRSLELRCWDIKIIGDYFPIGDFMSQTKDFTAAPDALGKLKFDVTLNRQILEVYTRTSDTDDGWSTDWNVWTPLSTAHSIISESKRYMRVRVKFITNVKFGAGTPLLNSFTVYHYSGSTTIPLANFAGMTVGQAISELATLPNYEIGFESQDTVGEIFPKYFFRRKLPDEIVDFILADYNHLKKVSVYDEGISWVRNRVEVTFGNYTARIDSVTEGEARPHSIDKYGVRKETLDLGKLIPESNIDTANSVAYSYYTKHKDPKFKVVAECDFLPQLDLGDTIQFTSSRMGISADLLKIEGIRIDFDNWKTQLDLREI